MSKIIVWDLESNGLLDVADKIHCIVMNELGTDKFYEITGNHDRIKKMYIKAIREGYVYVGHNTLGYDHVLLDSLYGISYSIAPDSINQTSVQIIDTLALSRELWPDRPGGHSLKAWQHRVTGRKPEVEDWEDQPLEVYVERCKSDVEITGNVFIELMKEAEIQYER